MPAKAVIDLDERYGDQKDLEIQFRGSCKGSNDKGQLTIYVTLYCWLSDKRKEENRKGRSCGWQYCPFNEGNKVAFTRHGTMLKGKIISISKDYCNSDCLPICIKLDSLSSKRYAKYVVVA